MNNIPNLQGKLPDNPMSTLKTWLDYAMAKQVRRNPNSMTIATISQHDDIVQPDARVVLCKQVNVEKGYVVFFTNYRSTKGQELEQTPLAAAVFHWDSFEVQARLQGPVVQSLVSDSDEYFASRPRDSQLGAWASHQSEIIGSRDALLKQLEAVEHRFADTEEIPRPPHWGGYQLWPHTLELWVGATGRLHDRIRWSRKLAPETDGFKTAAWTWTRLQP